MPPKPNWALLLHRRLQLVAGQAEPTAEELEGLSESEEGSDADGGSGNIAPKGVPLFWLTALCNEVHLVVPWL